VCPFRSSADHEHRLDAFGGLSLKGRLTPATFTLKNQSGQPIRSLTIEVAGKTLVASS
jgi:hypothetical protein